MKKKTLITSALPYINGVKHLGNVVGSMLPADVYARFLRQQGEEVIYICGTDEHGTPAEIGASKANMSISDYCKLNFDKQREIYQEFCFSFDYFGRSSSTINAETTQDIFRALDAAGYISEQSIKQFYSFEDERYLPDRYVEGECPHCNFNEARGDQCDNCGRLLDPEELINPRSAISGSKQLELRETKHLYLQLDKLETKVKDWIEKQNDWPSAVSGVAKKWLTEGLQARCITRDLKWGISVPKVGYEHKVFYVWFDAPIAYISITKEWARAIGKPDEWIRWWQAPDEVRLVQFMAKDNIPFHTVFWPAMMIAAGSEWVLADYIKGFNWLNYEGGKFSTSRQRGVFTDSALDLFPADYWRYGLLAMSPESSDADFSFEHFAILINKDLADTLGNFTNRVVAIINKHFDGHLPRGFELDEELQHNITDKVAKFTCELKEMKFRPAMTTLRSLWATGNEYITQVEPWKQIKTDKAKAVILLKNCLYLQYVFSIISEPIIPNLAKQLRLGLNLDDKAYNFNEVLETSWLNSEVKINKQAVLVEKIQPETVDELTERFAGKVS